MLIKCLKMLIIGLHMLVDSLYHSYLPDISKRYHGGGTLTPTLTLTLASIRQYSQQVTIGLPNDYCRGTYREIGYITVNRLHDIFVYASIT